MIARMILICLFGALSVAGQFWEQEDILRLARIKNAIRKHLDGMPNYTCQQTVERYERLPRAEREYLVDALRLEVAYVSGKEMFAWPGWTQFQDGLLGGLVTTGAFSTGGFVLHARSIFLEDGTTFRPGRAEELGSVPAWRFDYVTPQFRSGYQIQNPKLRQGAIVAYHGSIWARRDNLELMRIVIESDEIPPEIEIERVRNQMDYKLTPIGEGRALLPLASEMQIYDANGRLAINRTRLTRCKQYVGESTLKFEDMANVASAAPAKKLLELEPDMEIELALTKELNQEDFAVGDPIEATLVRDIKVGKTVVAPKGSLARGRILRLSRNEATYVTFNVTLEFTELEGIAFRAPLKLRFLRTEPYVSKPRQIIARRQGDYFFDAPTPDANGFLVFAKQLKLPQGFNTIWETRK